jgi:hypothetical protein
MMNIIVRNMIYGDIEDLSKAFAGQGWVMSPSIFEHYYNRVQHRFSDMLIAEVKGKPAGYVRLEWVDAGEEAGHALMPEIQEFIVLGRFAASGVAEAMIAETERRVAAKTGDVMENALMAIYSDMPLHPMNSCSYVLDGLMVGGEGKFIRTNTTERKPGTKVICMSRRI